VTALVEQPMVDGEVDTSYPVMSEPFELGTASHDTLLWPAAWVTVTFCGAQGAPAAAVDNNRLGVWVTPLRR
jgi:hypothetical protein